MGSTRRQGTPATPHLLGRVATFIIGASQPGASPKVTRAFCEKTKAELEVLFLDNVGARRGDSRPHRRRWRLDGPRAQGRASAPKYPPAVAAHRSRRGPPGVPSGTLAARPWADQQGHSHMR